MFVNTLYYTYIHVYTAKSAFITYIYIYMYIYM